MFNRCRQEHFNFVAMKFYPPFASSSTGARFVLLIGLIILGAVVSIGIAYLILIPMYGKEILTDPANMENIGYVRVMQILNQIGMFILPALALAWLTERKPNSYLGFRKPATNHMFGTFLVLFAIAVIVGELMELNEGMRLPESMKGLEDWMRRSEDNANGLVEWILSFTDPVSILINIFMVALLPAIGEELIFRSVLIRLFKSVFRNIHVAVWVSAIIFSAFHMQFYGFLPRMFLGLVFGYLFIWTGSVWVPILAHFLNNGMVLLGQYLYNSGVFNQDPSEIGKTDSWVWLILSIIATFILSLWYYKTRHIEVTGSESE